MSVDNLRGAQSLDILKLMRCCVDVKFSSTFHLRCSSSAESEILVRTVLHTIPCKCGRDGVLLGHFHVKKVKGLRSS